MSTTTTNLGLIKPELTDSADITLMNENWDKVDEQIQKNNDSRLKLLTSADDLNNIRESGHYYWTRDNAPLNLPNQIDDFNSMRVWGGMDGYCRQELYVCGNYYNGLGCVVVRHLGGNDSYSNWMWINPPLDNNKYLTTEQYMCMPVYAQLNDDGIVHKTTINGKDLTPITYGTTDITDGSASPYYDGCVHFVIE